MDKFIKNVYDLDGRGVLVQGVNGGRTAINPETNSIQIEDDGILSSNVKEVTKESTLASSDVIIDNNKKYNARLNKKTRRKGNIHDEAINYINSLKGMDTKLNLLDAHYGWSESVQGIVSRGNKGGSRLDMSKLHNLALDTNLKINHDFAAGLITAKDYKDTKEALNFQLNLHARGADKSVALKSLYANKATLLMKQGYSTTSEETQTAAKTLRGLEESRRTEEDQRFDNGVPIPNAIQANINDARENLSRVVESNYDKFNESEIAALDNGDYSKLEELGTFERLEQQGNSDILEEIVTSIGLMHNAVGAEGPEGDEALKQVEFMSDTANLTAPSVGGVLDGKVVQEVVGSVKHDDGSVSHTVVLRENNKDHEKVVKEIMGNKAIEKHNKLSALHNKELTKLELMKGNEWVYSPEEIKAQEQIVKNLAVVKKGSEKEMKKLVPNNEVKTTSKAVEPKEIKDVYDSNLQNHISKHEGFSEKPYWDHKQWSWGYGTKVPGSSNDKNKVPTGTISKEKAWKDAQKHLDSNNKAVNKYVKVPLTKKQKQSLMSFSYNVGNENFRTSTLLKKLNNKDYKGAAEEFDKWIYASGKVNEGLKKRRKDEKKMFLADL